MKITRKASARGQKAEAPAVHIKRRRQVGVAFFDPHGGHRFGLMLPGVVLPPLDEGDDEWVPQLSATQKKLAEWYEQDRQAVLDLADGDDIFLLMGGDVIQGTLLREQLLVSPRLSDQFAIAEHFLEPWCRLPNLRFMRFCKGTGVHVMNKGSAELTIAQHLRERFGKDISAWYHMDLKAYGVEIDVAHHGPPTGSRSWLRGNELRYYTRSIMDDHLKNGRRPPDLVLRGHYHDRTLELVHIHTWGETFRTWAAICPAYSIFADDYTLKATRSKDHMTAGLLAFEIIDGQVKQIYDWAHTLDIRKREVIN